jgi:hypothetical protein
MSRERTERQRAANTERREDRRDNRTESRKPIEFKYRQKRGDQGAESHGREIINAKTSCCYATCYESYPVLYCK